ncbi:MAG TPA: FAD-dependent oxidoreductase [Gemmatimonadales bacterium]|nr:FAD-dependent oxidoreductase [Gemmatimonadales bacterium]
MSRVVVVGAGIAGLAAAWDLTRAGADVTVLESERRPGGVIITEQRDGFLVEGGPDGFLASEPELPALAADLGITERIVAQQARGTSLWTGKAFEPLEEGRAAELLGIETRGSSLTAGFRSFAGGMAEPIAALAEGVVNGLRFTQGVTGIAPARAGWRVALTGGSAHEADGLVLALPAYAAGRWLEQIGVAGARALGDVFYAPSITVSLAYRADQIGRALDGTGFVVGAQHAAPLQIKACTYASSKFAGRAPDGHVLLRAFLAPVDDDPESLAHGQLTAILKIRGAPLWSRAFHWTRGLPRYREHHAAHVADVRDRLARLGPLTIAGAGYDGAGVSACVRSGREAARVLLGRLGT